MASNTYPWPMTPPVGIGTTTPSQALDVGGNINFGTAGYVSGNGGTSYFGTGSVLVSGSGTTDTGILTAANIVFGTNAGVGNLERMRITSAGNVGIGTTTPGALLDVEGSTIVVGLENKGYLQNDPIGYGATSGTIQIGFAFGAYAAIGLTGNINFSPSGSAGMVAGRVQTFDLTNTTGATVTLTWNPSWKLGNGQLPATLAAGASLRVVLCCTGTTEASILATYFQNQTPIATIAALRSLTAPTSAQFAVVATYASGFINGGGDGGGGVFLFDPADTTSRDDGGTIFVPGGSAPVVNSSGVITTPGTLATVGAWHRLEAMQAFFGGEGKKNVQWFGAVPDSGTDNTPAFRLAVASILYASGCVYIPAGQYALLTKWVIDLGLTAGTLTIMGDGPGATILEYGMSSTDTCMIEIKNGFGFGSLQDLQIHRAGFAGTVSNPSALWVHDTTSFSLLNVMMNGLIASDFTGGALKTGPVNTNLTIANCSVVGGTGVQLFWAGGSGLVSGCNFTSQSRGSSQLWHSGAAYVAGTVVNYLGRFYSAINNVTKHSVLSNCT